MSDIKINVQIVDGQAKAALDGIEKQAKSAEKQFKKTNESAQNLGNELQQAFRNNRIGAAIGDLKDFGSNLLALNPVVTALGAGIAAVGVITKQALAGEEIKAINEQFKLLATQAGASADALRSSLESVAAGTVDTEDLLQSTNKFIVEFNGNTERLPQVLDLARRATSLFGGEVTDNYERIGEAIASGNTRSLRQIGIIVDQQKAFDDFAKTIGVTADQLNEAGRKQAVLDAVLAKGNETFQNVNPNVRELSTSFERLKVQIGEIGDVVAQQSNGLFGPALAQAADRLANGLERLRVGFEAPKKGAEGLEQQIQKTQFSIDDINSSIESIQIRLDQGLTPGTKDIDLIQIDKLRSQKQELEETLEELAQRQLKFQTDTKASADQAAEDRSKYTDTAKLQKSVDETLKIEQTADALRFEQQLASDGQFTTQDELSLLAFKASQEQKLLEQQLADAKRLEDKQRVAELEAKIDQQRAAFALNTEKGLNKLKDEERKRDLQNQQSFFSAAISLSNSENKTLLTIGRAAALAQLAIKTPEAVGNSYEFGTKFGGPPLGALFAGIAATAMAAQAAQIVGVKFEDGGIVPGNSFSGDKVQARVNSGEMILNREQQANLFGLINGGGAGSQVIEVHSVVNLDGEVVGRSVSRQVANGLQLGEVV